MSCKIHRIWLRMTRLFAAAAIALAFPGCGKEEGTSGVSDEWRREILDLLRGEVVVAEIRIDRVYNYHVRFPEEKERQSSDLSVVRILKGELGDRRLDLGSWSPTDPIVEEGGRYVGIFDHRDYSIFPNNLYPVRNRYLYLVESEEAKSIEDLLVE